jgi:hypothetical protein
MSIYSDLTICCEIFRAAVSLLGVEQLFSVTAGCEPFSSLIFYTLRTFRSSKLLLKKLLSSHNVIWCRERFIEYWVDQNMLIADTATRVFTVLKQPDKNYLTQEDFRPILRELLATHRGLEFLHDTPEFQERYAETVIYRIFFYVNKAGNGQLQLREIKRSNLIAALQQVDEEEDINKVLRWVILPCSLSGHLSR